MSFKFQSNLYILQIYKVTLKTVTVCLSFPSHFRWRFQTLTTVFPFLKSSLQPSLLLFHCRWHFLLYNCSTYFPTPSLATTVIPELGPLDLLYVSWLNFMFTPLIHPKYLLVYLNGNFVILITLLFLLSPEPSTFAIYFMASLYLYVCVRESTPVVVTSLPTLDSLDYFQV